MTPGDVQIEKTLAWLQDRFEAAQNRVVKRGDLDKSKIYAKIAVLEVSGWVEESMDSLIMDNVDKYLQGENAGRRIRESIEDVHGFSYSRHFLKIIDGAIGSLSRQMIENNMDSGILEKFRNSLDVLSQRRDQLAHTSSHGTQTYLDAVPYTWDHARNIRKGLCAYRNAINRLVAAL